MNRGLRISVRIPTVIDSPLMWANFYLIVGGAAGALIGLQFVVMTLIANGPYVPRRDAGAAFATPTIVHFCAALLLSAIVEAPWSTLTTFAFVLAVFGLLGILYSIRVTVRMRSQKSYVPEFEDWLFHCILPFAAYGTIALSALFVSSDYYSHYALFGVGASALLILGIGIHNSWDAVTYHIFSRPGTEETDPPEESESTE